MSKLIALLYMFILNGLKMSCLAWKIVTEFSEKNIKHNIFNFSTQLTYPYYLSLVMVSDLRTILYIKYSSEIDTFFMEENAFYLIPRAVFRHIGHVGTHGFFYIFLNIQRSFWDFFWFFRLTKNRFPNPEKSTPYIHTVPIHLVNCTYPILNGKNWEDSITGGNENLSIYGNR